MGPGRSTINPRERHRNGTLIMERHWLPFLTGLLFIGIITLSNPVSAQRLMDANRSTIGYIEEGRVLNGYRSTIGYLERGRILSANRAS